MNQQTTFWRQPLLCIGLLTANFAVATTAWAEKPAKLKAADIERLKQDGDRFADQGDFQAALETYARAYMGVVARIRGQEFIQEVTPSTFNREQLGQEMLKLMASEYTPEELLLMDSSYKVFGLVPPELDSAELITTLLTEEVAGFYDPDNKRMVLILEEGSAEKPSWLGRLLGARQAFDKDDQKTTLAHELTHALQDQLYDLNAMEEGIEDDDDMLLAFSALVEGDATLLMFAEAEGEEDITEMDPEAMQATFNMVSWMMPLAGGKAYRSASAPIFRDSLTFPYLHGMLFTLNLATEEGWEAVHRAYQQPPLSTEQILHPEKYLDQPDAPQSVSIPDLTTQLGEDWKELGGNCLGELQTGILLKRVAGGKTAARGWDGDRYHVYQSPAGHLGLVYVSVWDSPEDAQEFAEAYRAYRQLAPEGNVEPVANEASAKPTGSTEAALPPNQAQGETAEPSETPAPRANSDVKAADAASPQTADKETAGKDTAGKDANATTIFAAGARHLVEQHGSVVWVVEGFDAAVGQRVLAELPNCQFEEKQFPLPSK